MKANNIFKKLFIWVAVNIFNFRPWNSTST